MFEPVLKFFFCFEVVTLLFELLYFVENRFRYFVWLAHLERDCVLGGCKFLIDRPFDAVHAFLNKLLEVIMIKIEGFAVPCVLCLFVEAVVIFDVEYFLDVKKHLDDPVSAGRPLRELCLQSQLSGRRVHERMEYLALENDLRHHLGVLSWEIHSELDDRI